MPDDDLTFAEAMRRDVLAGHQPELNPGDRARFQAEEEAQRAEQARARQGELEEAVDRAIEKARSEGKL
ncbi:hypothetical protein [Deinococcus aestuarii]|uniref:hypothetical protein n=1 Tax=Deinococcus aestuarii TaxID=2774531 RepID=UPI001C0DBA03|nr:hypothetical protein [Deinococcus aestuarii]